MRFLPWLVLFQLRPIPGRLSIRLRGVGSALLQVSAPSYHLKVLRALMLLKIKLESGSEWMKLVCIAALPLSLCEL